MSVYKLNNFEKETSILYNEAESTAEICTYNKALKSRLEKLAAEYPDECIECNRLGRDDLCKYIVPKKWIKVSPPKKMSEEQRQAAAERLKKYRR